MHDHEDDGNVLADGGVACEHIVADPKETDENSNNHAVFEEKETLVDNHGESVSTEHD